MKTGIITGGTAFHQNLFTNKAGKYANFFDEVLYILDLQEQNLSINHLDYLLVASRINPNLLMSIGEKLLSYLENGGNLILFGEFPKIFLPYIRWRACEVNFWWWTINGADLPLFAVDKNHSLWKFLEVKECKWHYHGVFYPTKQCEKILVNELGESIIYKDSYHFKGNLYVTSLDPDFHIAQGFMPTTEPFFDKFMQWVAYDIKTTQKYKKH